jgi:hypothetical protein
MKPLANSSAVTPHVAAFLRSNTSVRHKFFVLSKPTKVVATVLLSPLIAVMLLPAVFDLSKNNLTLAVFGLVFLLLPLWAIWRAPTPYSNQAYKVSRARRISSAESSSGSGSTSADAEVIGMPVPRDTLGFTDITEPLARINHVAFSDEPSNIWHI